MTYAVYVTHPRVAIDPLIPVPDWSLSERGRARAQAACRQPWMRDLDGIISSIERKAIETADILAASRGLVVEVRPHLHENDRTATGFLPPEEFAVLADEFFAKPDQSVRGWERAVDAQARVTTAFETIVAERRGPICLVGHGGVGTLLYCALAGLAIDRRHDQPEGGGCYFVFDIATRRMLHGWRPIDRFDGNP